MTINVILFLFTTSLYQAAQKIHEAAFLGFTKKRKMSSNESIELKFGTPIRVIIIDSTREIKLSREQTSFLSVL